MSLTNFFPAFFLSSGFLEEGEKEEEEGKAAREKSGRDGGLKVRLALPRSLLGRQRQRRRRRPSLCHLSLIPRPDKTPPTPLRYMGGRGGWAGGGGNLARALSTATYYYYYCIAQRGEEGGAGKETNLCKHSTLFTWPHIPPPF